MTTRRINLKRMQHALDELKRLAPRPHFEASYTNAIEGLTWAIDFFTREDEAFVEFFDIRED